jgi:hypothetical protein
MTAAGSACVRHVEAAAGGPVSCVHGAAAKRQVLQRERGAELPGSKLLCNNVLSRPPLTEAPGRTAFATNRVGPTVDHRR